MMVLQRTSGCWTWTIQVAAVGCCRWTDTCNWSLRVFCSGQSWILMFRSVNLHLMTLHKTTQIECLNSLSGFVPPAKSQSIDHYIGGIGRDLTDSPRTHRSNRFLSRPIRPLG